MLVDGVHDCINLITDACFQAIAVDGLVASIGRVVQANQKQFFVFGFYRLSGRIVRPNTQNTEATMIELKTEPEPEIAGFQLQIQGILQTSTSNKAGSTRYEFVTDCYRLPKLHFLTLGFIFLGPRLQPALEIGLRIITFFIDVVKRMLEMERFPISHQTPNLEIAPGNLLALG